MPIISLLMYNVQCTVYSVQCTKDETFFDLKFSEFKKTFPAFKKELGTAYTVCISLYNCTECVYIYPLAVYNLCVYLLVSFLSSNSRRFVITICELSFDYQSLTENSQNSMENMQRSSKDLLSPDELTKSMFSRNFTQQIAI